VEEEAEVEMIGEEEVIEEETEDSEVVMAEVEEADLVQEEMTEEGQDPPLTGEAPHGTIHLEHYPNPCQIWMWLLIVKMFSKYCICSQPQ